VAENFSTLVMLWHAQLVRTISKPEIVEGGSESCIFCRRPRWWRDHPRQAAFGFRRSFQTLQWYWAATRRADPARARRII